jgi:hypothetical protein
MSKQHDEEALLFDFKEQLEKSKPPPNDAELVSALRREVQKISKSVTIGTIIAMVITIMSASVVAGVIVLSPIINPDRKIFFGCLLLAGMVGLTIIVCASRADPSTQIIFNLMLASFSSFGMALSINYT